MTTKWDLSKSEKFALEWFKANNFHAIIKKQYVSKTIFEVSKDSMTDTFELPQGIVFKSISGFMEQYAKHWEQLKLINQLTKGND